MAVRIFLFFLLQLRLHAVVPHVSHVSQSLQITINISAPLLIQDPQLVSQQSETFRTLSMAESFLDPRFIRAASSLAPAMLRVGGTSADFVNYVLDYSNDTSLPCNNSDYPFPMPQSLNFTLYHLEAMVNFSRAAGFSLMIDVNELTGRTCNHTFCSLTPWDTRSLRGFLMHAKDASLPIAALELGNELSLWVKSAAGWISEDTVAFSALLDDVWGSSPERPALFTPGAAECDAATLSLFPLVEGLPGVRGVSFHDYPFGNNPNEKLLNASLLRALGTTSACLPVWNAGPRARGVELFLTETASSYVAGEALTSFLDGFFTLASIGGYARSGVARWARTQITDPCSTFALLHLHPDEQQWEAAHDYFIMAMHQQLVGPGVLSVAGDGASQTAVYAYCGHVRGSIVLAAINVGAAEALLTLVTDGVAALASTPRLEWVFTAPGGNLSSTAAILNGGGQTLRLQPDGSLPSMPPAQVPTGGRADITLPPYSQGYFVLPAAAAKACGY